MNAGRATVFFNASRWWVLWLKLGGSQRDSGLVIIVSVFAVTKGRTRTHRGPSSSSLQACVSLIIISVSPLICPLIAC